MPTRFNLVGRRFASLVVIGKVENTPSGTRWLCLCDCGNNVLKITTQLSRGGNTGCRRCEPRRRAAVHLVHGESRGPGKTKLYGIWKGMHRRCRNPTDISWKYYGGKGVRVCEEWTQYANFSVWARSHGYELGLSIDRLDASSHYSPENCQWVTRSENSRRAIVARHAKLDS